MIPDGGALPSVKVLLFGTAAHKSPYCETCSVSPFLQVSPERKSTGLRIFFISLYTQFLVCTMGIMYCDVAVTEKRVQFSLQVFFTGDKCRSSRKPAADALTTEAGMVASFGFLKSCV